MSGLQPDAFNHSATDTLSSGLDLNQWNKVLQTFALDHSATTTYSEGYPGLEPEAENLEGSRVYTNYTNTPLFQKTKKPINFRLSVFLNLYLYSIYLIHR